MKKMSRLIDADNIKIKPEYMHDICGVVMIRVEDIARILNDMPTIKPEPYNEKQNPMLVRNIHIDEYYCPRCGSENLCNNKKVEDKFCPNCGQALKAGEEDG